MVINIRVPDEAVRQISLVLRYHLKCSYPFDCQICNEIVGCECLKALADACSEINDVSNYVCEVSFNEE